MSAELLILQLPFRKLRPGTASSDRSIFDGLPGSNYGATAIASKLVPRGVLCLYSALYVHKLLDKPPERVWMAIGPKDRRPRHANMRFVRFSRAALTEGVEQSYMEGIRVRVYSVAKTIADCFKYRHKIDIRVGIDALTRAVRDHRCGRRELHRFARICRVSKIMEPLLISAWRSRSTSREGGPRPW